MSSKALARCSSKMVLSILAPSITISCSQQRLSLSLGMETGSREESSRIRSMVRVVNTNMLTLISMKEASEETSRKALGKFN